MFHGHNERSGRAGGDRGCTAHVDHVAGDRLNFGFPGHVDPPEDDSGILRGGQDPQMRPDSGMKCDPGDRHFLFHCILIVHLIFYFPLRFQIQSRKL